MNPTPNFSNMFQSKYHFIDTHFRSAFAGGYNPREDSYTARMKAISIMESVHNVSSVNDIPYDIMNSFVSTVNMNPFDGKTYYIVWLMEFANNLAFGFKLSDMDVVLSIIGIPEYFKSFIKGEENVSFDEEKSIDLAHKIRVIYDKQFDLSIVESIYLTIYTMFNLYQYHGIPCFEKGVSVEDAVSFIRKSYDKNTVVFDYRYFDRVADDYKKMISRVGKFSIDPYTISSSSFRIETSPLQYKNTSDKSEDTADNDEEKEDVIDDEDKEEDDI